MHHSDPCDTDAGCCTWVSMRQPTNRGAVGGGEDGGFMFQNIPVFRKGIVYLHTKKDLRRTTSTKSYTTSSAHQGQAPAEEFQVPGERLSRQKRLEI